MEFGTLCNRRLCNIWRVRQVFPYLVFDMWAVRSVQRWNPLADRCVCTWFTFDVCCGPPGHAGFRVWALGGRAFRVSRLRQSACRLLCNAASDVPPRHNGGNLSSSVLQLSGSPRGP